MFAALIEVMVITSQYALAPVIDTNARVLILGALSGDQTSQIDQYYTHPSDQFWTLLGGVYGTDVPEPYDEKLAFSLQRGIALWNVRLVDDIGQPLDHAVYDGLAKQMQRLLGQYSGIGAIGFNGIEVGNAFRRHFVRTERVALPNHVRTEMLPSSMAVQGKYVISLEDKVKRWRSFLHQ